MFEDCAVINHCLLFDCGLTITIYLIQYNIIGVADREGHGLLQLAILNGKKNITKYLITKLKFDPKRKH